MGRFYRTAAANPMDYMYRANVPLMAQVIQANDQYITQDLGQAAQIGQLASFSHLSQDDADAQKITDDYSSQVDNITKAILKDPASWRNQIGSIRDLTKKITSDYNTGAISKYVGNYNARKQAFDAVDKQVELYNTSGGTKGVSPERATAYKNSWDSNFQGTKYNPSNPNGYNVYKAGTVMDDLNIPKLLEDGLDKIKADKSYQYEEKPDGSQWYFNKVTKKVEQITPEKVLQIATGNITPQILNYLNADSQVGLVDKKALSNPYLLAQTPISDNEQKNIDYLTDKINKSKGDIKTQLQQQLNDYKQQLSNRTSINWNKDSYFTPILQKLMNQYSYSSVEEGNEMKNNSVGSTLYTQGQENFRQGRSLAQSWQIHQDTMDNAKEKMKQEQEHWQKEYEEKQYEFRNPQAKLSTTKLAPNTTTSKSTTSETNPQQFPTQTGVSSLSTRSFENWSTTDIKTGQKVPVLSNAGLSSDINTLKKAKETIDNQLKDINNKLSNSNLSVNDRNVLIASKQKLLTLSQATTSELNDRRQFYKASVDAVMNDANKAGNPLSKKDKDLYNEFSTDREGNKFRQHILDLKKQYPDVHTGKYASAGTGSPGNEIIEESPQVIAARDKLVNYIDVKNRFDKNRDTWLANVRGDMINTDAIQLNKNDSKDISDIILSNPRGTQLFDDIGNSTNGIQLEGKGVSWFNPRGDNYKLTFDNNDLKNYMDRYGVTMNVTKIGNTTNIGNGNAVAEVTFHDPTGNIPSNKKYYISLNDDLQTKIGSKFKGYNQVGVSDIASDILDREANSIRNQMMRPSINRSLNNTNPQEPSSFTITVQSRDGRTIPLNVTRFIDGNQDHYNVTMTTTDGKQIPFPRVTIGKDGNITNDPNAIPGFFNGINDFISQFKLQR